MLKLYNTLSGKKEVFRPRRTKKINMFVCGPTVYDFSHLGHARTYVVFDMIAKYFRQKGYDVFYLQNITDIDDKIIQRAKEKKISPQKLARNFEKEYLKDMKTLKIDSVTKYARATDYIKEIAGQVAGLIQKGFAYLIKDGVYYDISMFKNYGKLSGRSVLQAEDAISRIDESKEKRNKGDFCLWKFSKSGEPKWPFDSSLRSSLRTGRPKAGRPGWHIEDTAITEKHFGPQYDIHGGARDLIFPHHEAEIAQMESISGKKPLVRYWLHTGFLTIEGQKMAKSLKNFITMRDFWEGKRAHVLTPHSPRFLRFLILKSHYRSPIDYSGKLLGQTKNELEKIDEFIDKIQNSKHEAQNKSEIQISKFKITFEDAMEDDFNTPKAIAVIFNLISEGYALAAQNKLSPADAKKILEFLGKIDKVLGFIFGEKIKIPKEILELAKEREKYRRGGLWQKADELRLKIKEMGWQVEDTTEGPRIKKI